MLQAFAPYKIVAVVPAFNEERFIGSVILKTKKHVDQVIVVDDGSRDATADIAREAGAILVAHDQNQGKGEALNNGLRAARELGADVVVVLDGDGQHLPEEMALVTAPVLQNEADIVVGSRYIQRGCTVPRHRILGHWFFNMLTGAASGIHVTDSQSGFRAFSRHALEVLNFQSAGFSVESEMQFIAHEKQLRVKEVPITIRYLDPPKRSVLGQGLNVLNGVLRLVGQYRPLLFFGPLAAMIILAGLGLGFLIIDIYQRTTNLAVGYALISVLLFIIGTVTFSTGVILHSVRGLLQDTLQARSQA
ncbi:MAG TPA: glycosyltransferase family 2 protein [Chloroflexota bacterium]|nr:glycosyltransferase family 2 protein [Chloroflexota bacterium]HUM67372.1 glycosyltransferase family 2 protein [Chloroflexota bacterium]